MNGGSPGVCPLNGGSHINSDSLSDDDIFKVLKNKIFVVDFSEAKTYPAHENTKVHEVTFLVFFNSKLNSHHSY